MWSGWILLIVDSKRDGMGVPTICIFSIYNIFSLGTEKGWSGWYLLIVDSIRGGKGGSS